MRWFLDDRILSYNDCISSWEDVHYDAIPWQQIPCYTQILAYVTVTHNMSRSQLFSGICHVSKLLSSFNNIFMSLWLNYVSSVELFSCFWLTYYCSLWFCCSIWVLLNDFSKLIQSISHVIYMVVVGGGGHIWSFCVENHTNPVSQSV